MSERSTSRARRALVCAGGAILAASLFVLPASAQMREQMKAKIVNDVADQMVTTIQNDSCPQFAQMLKQSKGGGSGSSSSGKAASAMKSDPALREQFVNKVAGPLLNKMIDCDMLPSK